MLTTNFKTLKEAGRFKHLYRKLVINLHLGGVRKYGNETPITLLQILDLLGFDDALLVLDYAIIPEQAKEAKLFAMKLKADFAERVLYIFERVYPDNDKPRRAIEITRKYVAGEATEEELDAARKDAEAAAWAARAARAAAMAARAVTGAAWAAGAVTGAARAARAAWAAWAAKIAGDTGAAMAAMAAWDAWDAGDADAALAAWDAWDAWDETYDIERREQEKILRAYLDENEFFHKYKKNIKKRAMS